MKAIDVFNILDEIKKNNKVLFIQTALKVIKVDKRCVDRFERAGYQILKNAPKDENGFYIASGKNFVFVGPGCKVWLK